MSVGISAMITAVVGVLGTLFAPLLAQRLTARARAAEEQAADERRKFEERRAQYTAMNRASRQFHTLLKDALHRINDGVYTGQERAHLEAARLDHRDRYAEAQMIVPERILRASQDVNRVLSEADAVVKRLDRGHARPGETAAQGLENLKEVMPFLIAMRRLMRADLGVTD
ncbi:hypothetical protein [Streptomyces sp. SYSU K21746]